MQSTKTKHPPRSTAVKTKMLTVCKRCGQPNDNGYQYCTACHKAYTGRSERTLATRAVQVSFIDPDEVLRVAAMEACEAVPDLLVEEEPVE